VPKVIDGTYRPFDRKLPFCYPPNPVISDARSKLGSGDTLEHFGGRPTVSPYQGPATGRERGAGAIVSLWPQTAFSPRSVATPNTAQEPPPRPRAFCVAFDAGCGIDADSGKLPRNRAD
jgi:hypothetical protein